MSTYSLLLNTRPFGFRAAFNPKRLKKIANPIISPVKPQLGLFHVLYRYSGAKVKRAASLPAQFELGLN